MKGLLKRGSTWHLVRRVPTDFHDVEPRRVVTFSLKTDSKQIAAEKAALVWRNLLDGWQALTDGRSADADRQFKTAQRICAQRGVQYLPVTEVAELPLADVLQRVEAAIQTKGQVDAHVAAATLGTIAEPKLLLSQLVDHVEQLSAHENRFKNTAQMTAWRTPRHRAVANLKAAIGGDKPVAQLSRADVLKHRSFWEKRIREEGLQIETANKDFTNMAGMLARYYKDLNVEDPPRIYSGINLTDRHKVVTRKAELPVSFILEKWFADGALDCLNEEVRDILLISLETGCRQSEIYNLPASAFELDAPIPHIVIKNEEGVREIKNKHSARLVPLLGVALAAAKRNPNGFPRYRGKNGYSNAVNKTLRENELLPRGVTVGGLRHTFESRLKSDKIQSDDRGELMGHSVASVRGREWYGDAMQLEQRAAIMQVIAFPVPDYLK